jgi:hypothetical protein
MPTRLSDPLPRASSRAAAAAYSRTGAGAAASLRAPRPRHTARPGTTWPGLRHKGATPHEPGPANKARNNSGEYPLSPEGAKPLLSRADLLPSCYQDALPRTPKYPYLYSNYFYDLGGAKEIRTPDLLHAMKARHFR